MSSPTPRDDDSAAEPDQLVAPAAGNSPPPVTAQMTQVDPRITHDVLEHSDPSHPAHTFRGDQNS